MSASLVGSEMCIRDRFLQCAITFDVCAKVIRRVPLGPAGSETLRCLGAVSYTHLTLPTICSV
eukprot:7794062-Alexandrium_andersonii.AAC.1